MSERSARRGLLRCTALVTAAVLAFGGTSTALAQDDPTSTSPTPTPTETVTPPPSSEQPTPPSSEQPTTPSSSEPTSANPTPSPDPSTPVAPPAATVEPAKPDEKKAEEKTEQKAAEQPAPDLKLSLSFDKPEYVQGEPVSLTATVRNAGDAPANQIRFASEPFQMNLTSGVDELISRPSLAPGESKTFKLGGIAQFSAPNVAFTLRTYAEGTTDKAPNDNQARAEATITKKVGRLSGVVYEDKNGNGVADPGEGLGNYQQVKLVGGIDFPGSTFTVYNGQFSIYEVPAGTYQARMAGGYNPSGEIAMKPGQFIVVKEGESTEVSLQVVPVLSRSLRVTGASFDKPKYARGDAISVSVTLTNSGTAPISNLVAVCDPENDPATLDGTAEGWGELRPDRSGVTIGAGETKTFTVTDTVPDVDYPTGKVYFACAFSVDGRNIDGRIGRPGAADPGLTIGADVAGTIGKVSGRVLSNGSPVGEQVKVVAYNAQNNRIVGDAQSYDSKWSILDVPQGKVALQVVGRWKFADGSSRRLVDVVGDQDTVADLDVVSGPEVKDPTVFAPDLKVSVTFDKATYDINDTMLMSLKVENVGTGKSPARGSWNGTPYNEEEPYYNSVELRRFLEAQIELWPGESKQITLTARPRDGGMDQEKLRKLRYFAQVGTQSADADQSNNQAEARADVVWGTGAFSAVVYGDVNLNGKRDAGEELANRTVNVGGGKPWVNLTGKTDATGRVRFTDVPAGRFSAADRGDRETGWVPAASNSDEEQNAVVNPGDEGTAQVRMIRPLSDKLKASLTFDQPSYSAGATVGLTASIKNETGKPINVKAECGGPYGPYLGNQEAVWGPLTRDAAGVEIADGATYTLHVDSPMPAESPDYGYVAISCTFGPDFGQGAPFARATAKVPGATETFHGKIVTGDFMNPAKVPNVKVVLLDPATNRPVASTTANAEGAWVFPDLPVGPYKPVVVGPWRVMDELWQEGEGFGNVRGRTYDSWIWVAPGPDVSDPENAGKYTITAVHDADRDGPEPGEEISGLKISFRDKVTGAVVAERTTGPDGKAVFTDVPAGTYWARVEGSWRFQGGASAWDVIIGGPGKESTFYLVPGVAAGETRGLLRFEKASYESHEKVRFWLTVTNVGGQTAEQVRLDSSINDVELPQDVWGDFSPQGKGIQLAPGESRTFEAEGYIRDYRDGKLYLWGGIYYAGRPNSHQSGYSAQVPVVQTKGELSGVLYTDKNYNRKQDAGEATAGAQVTAGGGAPRGEFKTTTDAEGRYSFKDLPSGDYWVGYQIPDGSLVHYEGQESKIRVQPGKPVQLTARAERPYTESLSATLTLDKETYQVGEEAKITITVTNSGDRELGSIMAWCARAGNGNELGGEPGGPGTGWGELLPPGKGVTVGPGETRTFVATEKIPQAALNRGRVTVSCGIGPYAGWNSDAVEVRDFARVPGGFGSLSGDLYYDRNGNWRLDPGEAIGNTRIVLHDRERGVDVAETVSDAQGHVRFDNVPAGEYFTQVDGPWKFEGEWGGHVQVEAGRENLTGFPVVPDLPAAAGGGGGNTPPASAGGTADALAKTGASVLGLGLVGALLVAFGFGAAAVGRRRVA